MSDRIMRECSKDFVLRMQDWARKVGGVPLPTAWPTDGTVGDGCKQHYYQARLPVIMGMSHDTDMALAEIPPRYSQAVRQYWLFEGRPLRWHGRHRGVEHRTFEAWVLKGHELLKAIFARNTERWHREHPQRSRPAARLQRVAGA